MKRRCWHFWRWAVYIGGHGKWCPQCLAKYWTLGDIRVLPPECRESGSENE